jgi:hypothetical protein
MPLSADELAVVRSWVGDEPLTADLDAIFDATSNYDEVVLQTLRKRLSNFTSDPASFSVPGLSITNGQNMISIEGMLKKFEAAGGTGLGTTTLTVNSARLKRIVPR